MLQSELVELAKTVCTQKAETQTVEVKAAYRGCPKGLKDTLSSFSNQDSGGVILFGIDEAAGFSPVGIYDPQDLQKQVTEQCNQMEPPVRAVFTLAEYQGKEICSAEIPPIVFSERPCYYKGTGRLKGSYVRVGDADLHMTDYEIYSYEAFRRHAHDDARPLENIPLSMLDEDTVESYLRSQRQNRPGFSRLTKEQALELLCVTRDGHPTVAALMNMGLFPQGRFPQWGITAIVVPGREIGDLAPDAARFLDNRRIEGTISGMAAEAMQFCLRNMKVRTVIDPADGVRRDRTEYPPDAVREAILNALIHRDYSFYTEGTPVQIDFFTDRLEIHSPGTLYGQMTVEQLGYAKPDLRNPALAVMAETLTGSENRYSGIPTMRRELAAYGLPAPIFENRRNEFVVTFYNAAETDRGGGTRWGKAEERETDPKALLDYCGTPRTRQEIAAFLRVKTTFYAMKRYVQPLLDAGKLAMTLPDHPRSRNQKYYAT